MRSPRATSESAVCAEMSERNAESAWHAFCNWAMTSGKVRICSAGCCWFKEAGNQLPMHTFEPLQVRLGCSRRRRVRAASMVLKIRSVTPAMAETTTTTRSCCAACANNCRALAEPLGIAHGSAAKLHHDQTLSVHCDFSSFCNTAPVFPPAAPVRV